MGFESLTITDGTGGDIIVNLAFAVAFIVLLKLGYELVQDRRNSYNFYKDHVVAYRVGRIKKTAAEKNITLCFAPDVIEDYMETIDKSIEEDLGADIE